MFGKKDGQQLPRRRRTTEAVENVPTSDVRSFRRNRTITGSTSPHIASGNELNAEMVSPRAKVHHLVRHRRRLFGRLVMVGIICLGVYILLGQLVASVSVVATDSLRLDTRTAARYGETVDNYFSSHINERFRPSLNQESFTAYLQQSHPEIKQASLVMTGAFGDAQLQLAFRQPVARWIIGEQTQFVDDNGVVFRDSIYPTPALKIIDKNATTLESGLVTSNRFLSFVGRVVGDLRQRGYRVTEATIPTLTTRQLEIKIKGVSYRFKLTVDRSAGGQSEDIARLVRYFKSRSKPDYVDVRVKGKAFYK